jgi:hypothetical protein
VSNNKQTLRRSILVAVAVICAACAGRTPYRGTPREWLPAELKRSVSAISVGLTTEQAPIPILRRNAYVKECRGGVEVGAYAEIRFSSVSVRSGQEGVWVESTGENGILYAIRPVARPDDYRSSGTRASPPPLAWTKLPPGTSLRQWSYPTLLIRTDSDSATARIAKGFQDLVAECSAKKAE